MKKIFYITPVTFTGAILFLTTGCNKSDVISTTSGAPTAVTKYAKYSSATEATLFGHVNANGIPTTVTFEYGTTTSYGSTVTAYQNPVKGNYLQHVSADISDLTPDSAFYFRVKAENSYGTTYGNQISYNTKIADVDGNNYNTVTIGTQEWMAENLKTTKYLNGDPIPSDLTDNEWVNTTSGAFKISSDIYGNLYNAYAVADTRKICPVGWHVPSASEWDELLIYLGGEDNAGGPMKETGTSHWFEPNVGATNESGFTALPAGLTHPFDGTVESVGSNAVWWSSSKQDIWYWTVQCSFASTYAVRTEDKMNEGHSVRCIKDK